MNAIIRENDARFLRVPPQSTEAEQSVLGGLMLAPKELARMKLDESDFYRRDHAAIFRAINELEAAGQPFDAVTVGEWFEARGQSDLVQGGAYLVELSSTVFSAANIHGYAKVVRDKAILRKLIEVGTQVVNDGFAPDGRDSNQILDAAIRELMVLSKAEQKCDFTLQQAARLAWDDAQVAYEHKGQIRGVTSGYQRIDRRLGGFHKGDLIILGARPSMGKTALMVNLALNAAKAGHYVGMVSGEQSAMQIGQRSIAAESHVAAERLRNGDIDDEAWPKLTEAMRRMIDRSVRIYDRSAPTMDELARTARRWKQDHDISILFVDYLQRIRCPKADNRIEEVSEVSRGLKSLARDLEIPVVALAQVKAEVDKRQGDKRPGLGDVANSDEATREADLIGFLYRDEVYNDESNDRGIAELNFEKNRHGPTGRFRLSFVGETMVFSDLAHSDFDRPYTPSGKDRAAGE